VSGNEHTPNKEYPDARHGARGEPGGLPHYSDRELETIAETRAQQDEALREHERPSRWRRWFHARSRD
jgi:hypothetical protein